METRDGFIIGIYNYCDRWCERCRLAARCRVHVDEQLERQGTGLEARGPALLPRGETADEGARAPSSVAEGMMPPGDEPAIQDRPSLCPESDALGRRAQVLGDALLDWRVPAAKPADPAVGEALRVIGHFGFFLGPKVHRALVGLEEGDSVDARRDADGSAKAALLALDELESSWLQLAEAGLVGVADAEPLMREMADLKEALEGRFPAARGFVRPGLDEPAAVAMLEWRERG